MAENVLHGGTAGGFHRGAGMRGNEFLAVLNSHGGAVRKWVSVVSRREWTTPGCLRRNSRALKGWGVAVQELWLYPLDKDG